jgi:hypothetical protein
VPIKTQVKVLKEQLSQSETKNKNMLHSLKGGIETAEVSTQYPEQAEEDVLLPQGPKASLKPVPGQAHVFGSLKLEVINQTVFLFVLVRKEKKKKKNQISRFYSTC